MCPHGSFFGNEPGSSGGAPATGACISSLQMMQMSSVASSSGVALGLSIVRKHNSSSAYQHDATTKRAFPETKPGTILRKINPPRRKCKKKWTNTYNKSSERIAFRDWMKSLTRLTNEENVAHRSRIICSGKPVLYRYVVQASAAKTRQHNRFAKPNESAFRVPSSPYTHRRITLGHRVRQASTH